jgi:predicted phage tail component-like protein
MSFSITIGGTVLPIKVKSVTGRGPLNQEVTRRDTGNGEGSVITKRRIPERILNVSFDISASSLDEMRDKVDQLSSMLYYDEAQPTVFSDEPEFTYYSILSGEPAWDEVVHRGRGVLTLVCPKPRKMKAEVISNLGVVASANEVLSNTLRTMSAEPIFTVTFSSPSSSFQINHQQSGKLLKVTYNFLAGDILVIDKTTRKITINGNVRMATFSLASDWFNLAGGSNNLTFTPGNVASVQISYKPSIL